MVYGFLLLSSLGVVIAQGLPLLRTVSMPPLLEQPQRDNQPRQITSSLPPSPPQVLSQVSQSTTPALKPPAGAIAIPPGRDIQAVVDRYPPGTAFLLKAGTHRLQSIRPKAGNAFYGEISPTGKRLTTLNGSRQIVQFGRLGSLYVISGQTQKGQVHGSAQKGWERSKHPEDLFIDDRPLKHVGSISEVKSGTWFFDYPNDTVYFADNPAGKKIEISSTRTAFRPSAPNVKVYGLIVEKYAIPAQMGAIGDQYPQESWQIKGNEVRLNHGVGIKLGSNSLARDNYIHSNGQLGIAANGDNITIEDNEVSSNNYANFSCAWECGGSKFAKTRNLVIRNNFVHHNRGPGLWTDIDNIGTLYENNIVYANRNEGIFHEVSFDAIIRNNKLGHNGEETKWLYGANILISNSRNVQVYGNEVEVNPNFGNGIGIIWQDRGTGYVATGNRVFNNRVTYLGKAGRSGAASDTPPGKSLIFKSNSFNQNLYFTKNTSAKHFSWNNSNLDFSQFQSYGQDRQGKIDQEVTPLNWSKITSTFTNEH
jgi:hypothetical protein